MFMGAVFLSHSPLITGMKSEGKGVEYDEMLSRRLKHPHHAAHGRPCPTAGCRRSRPPDRPAADSGPLHHQARHARRSGRGATGARRAAPPRSRRRSRPGRWRPATRTAAPVVGLCRRRPPRPNTAGTSSAVTSKGGPSPRMLRRSAIECGAVGPPCRPGRPRSGGPRPRAHHPGEEPLGLLRRDRRPGSASRRCPPRPRRKPSHGMGGSKAADGVEGPGSGQRGADHDVAAEAVPDGHHRAVPAIGARRPRRWPGGRRRGRPRSDDPAAPASPGSPGGRRPAW